MNIKIYKTLYNKTYFRYFLMIRHNTIQLFDSLKCLSAFMIFTVRFYEKVDYHLKRNVYVLFQQEKC